MYKSSFMLQNFSEPGILGYLSRMTESKSGAKFASFGSGKMALCTLFDLYNSVLKRESHRRGNKMANYCHGWGVKR